MLELLRVYDALFRGVCGSEGSSCCALRLLSPPVQEDLPPAEKKLVDDELEPRSEGSWVELLHERTKLGGANPLDLANFVWVRCQCDGCGDEQNVVD